MALYILPPNKLTLQRRPCLYDTYDKHARREVRKASFNSEFEFIYILQILSRLVPLDTEQVKGLHTLVCCCFDDSLCHTERCYSVQGK
jgi:hypothetical protein